MEQTLDYRSHRGVLTLLGYIRDPIAPMPDHVAVPAGRALRYALAAGILTADRLRERESYANRHGVDIPTVLTDAERMHALLILKALGSAATLADALAAIRDQATVVAG